MRYVSLQLSESFQSQCVTRAKVRTIESSRSTEIDVEILKCKQFPQVEIPEVFVSHIRKNTKEHLRREQVA